MSSRSVPFAPPAAANLGEQLARIALRCIRTESPHCMDDPPGEPRRSPTPKQANPAFYGCYDWHSAVHSHWLLVRLLRLHAGAPLLPESLAQAVQDQLAQSLGKAKLEAEFAYLNARPRFERPYGLAWLLTLCKEVRLLALCDGGSATPAQQNFHTANIIGPAAWCSALEPLQTLSAERLLSWLSALPFPVRTGEHGQSAFALGLLLDWAQGTPTFEAAAELALRHYAADHSAPLHLEPSGSDFLSPSLAVCDTLARVLSPGEFARFSERYFCKDFLLTPVACPDLSDGKLAHLVGLNLSRGWMLARASHALPEGQALRQKLHSLAAQHRALGLRQCGFGPPARLRIRPETLSAPQAEAISPELPYSLSHWIGSFVLYGETWRLGDG